MDFFDAVRRRRSTRLYQNRIIEAKKLELLLETVNLAPSARNRQSYEIFIASTEEKKRALVDSLHGKEYAVNAPVILVFCANPEKIRASTLASPLSADNMNLLAIEDATIAASYCQLAATALGLSTVWISPSDPDKVLKVINGGKGLIPITIIPIGYPAEHPDAQPRRSLADLVHEI
jgi:nitroreductase